VFLKVRRSGLLRLTFTLQRALSYVLLSTVLGLVLVQVYTRYVLNSPFTWTEEIARFATVWFTFIAASYVMAERRHIKVIFFDRLLGSLGRNIVQWFAQVVVIGVSLVMLYGSYLASEASQISGTASGLPMSFVYYGALIGYALMVLHAVVEAIDTATGRVQPSIEQDLLSVGD
jgi:TRAP-type C4-dicarboxylate transport system permease small subunit